MSWPYRFDFSLTAEQLAHRRYLLDSYGQLAQYSIVFPLLCFQILFVSGFLVSQAQWFKTRKEERITEPREWSSSELTGDIFSPLLRITRKIKWVLDNEILLEWGTWKQAVFAVLWGSWLLTVVIRDTGDDYMHITKRFGIVAASQLPLHYLLSAKPSYNPIQYLTNLSHEELNPYHRIFGYILTSLFVAHATLYLNFYIQMGFLAKRIRDIDVQLGLAAVTSFAIIGISAISYIRHYSYRIFYTLHIVLSFAILPMLYFHVKYLRIYILETGAVYVFLVLQRYVTKQYPATATVSVIPNTSLIKISLPMTALPQQKKYRPGQHVYLSRPLLEQPSSSNLSHMNPFSIANLPSEDSPHIELIVRELDGSTKMIADAARHGEGGPINFLLEGPYGSAEKFSNLMTYDHILFFAGGVGATFTLPIYVDLIRRTSRDDDNGKAAVTARVVPKNGQARRTVASNVSGKAVGRSEISSTGTKQKASITNKLSFIWSVRTPNDAIWGLDAIRKEYGCLPHGFELFVSGKPKEAQHPTRASNIKESSFAAEEASTLEQADVKHATKPGRPQVNEIVERVFSRSESQRVAVLVCGPAALGRDVRREVGKWVWQGRDVWWHEEQFSW